MNSIYKQPKKEPHLADRLATCSVLCGVVGFLCSLFYPMITLASGRNYSMGLFCAAAGLVLALLSRRFDEQPKKRFRRRALAGLILSCLSIAVTFFFFYALINYYDALRDPVLGPQINSLLLQWQEQLGLPQATAPVG